MTSNACQPLASNAERPAQRWTCMSGQLLDYKCSAAMSARKMTIERQPPGSLAFGIMIFKGNLTPGQDVTVELTAASTNKSPVLVTLAEVPRSGHSPRLEHGMVVPGGSAELRLSKLAGIAVRVDIDVVEPESVTVRVSQNGAIRVEGTVNEDEKWVFSAAS
jgi:hypothetical protein